MPEIEETELANYKAIAQNYQQLLANPKTRLDTLRLQKVLRPDAVIPELDAAKPVLDEVAALRAEMVADKKARDEKDAKTVEESTLSALRADWAKGQDLARRSGYTTPDSLKALEDYMQANNIIDHKLGVLGYEHDNPAPPMIDPSGGRNFNVFGAQGQAQSDDRIKMLMEGKDEAFLNLVIPETLREVRGMGGAR